MALIQRTPMKKKPQLVNSQQLFRDIFDHSPVAITVSDKNEKVIACNPFAAKILGVSVKDILHRPVKELYPPKEWRRIRSLRIRRKGIAPHFETTVIRKDGSLLEVSVSIAVLKDATGAVTASIGIMRDISKRKMAEKKFKESENTMRIVLDNTAAAIMLIDQKERIVSWNPYTESLFGMKKKDLFHQPVSILYPPSEWETIRAANIRRLGAKHHLETQIITKQGKKIDVDLSVNVLKDANDAVVGSVGIIQDMSERKKTNDMLLKAIVAAEEANASKTAFLANMSHEVRTPMNAIIGMLDMTLDTPLNDEQQDNLKTAKDAADNLLNLLNDILDLSRIEAGKITMEEIAFDLRNLIKGVCKGLFVLARNKNLELAWNVDNDVPVVLVGDPARLRQVLINLVNNAIKFTKQGKIEIAARIASTRKQSCQLTLSVTDTGIGIPKEKQKAIFDSFSQADATITRRFGGTGLGLAISKRLVELMGGKITVDSVPGKGSTFSFTPIFNFKERSVAVIDKAAGMASAGASTGDGKKKRTVHLLVAEDNLVNQRIVVKLLEKRGWTVYAVEDGQQVLDALKKDSFDLIVMDVQMPVMDGLKATEMIRKQEKKTGAHIPIVALTARAMQGDEQKCLNAGMDGYVAKPIDRTVLYETIEKHVSQRKK